MRDIVESGELPDYLYWRWSSDVPGLKYLIDCLGFHVEKTITTWNYTMLMHAASSNRIDCVRLLLYNYNANINAKNEFGQTVLMLSFLHNKTDDTIRLLLGHPDLDITLCDNQGRHVLWYALSNQQCCSYKQIVSMVTDKKVLQLSLVQTVFLDSERKHIIQNALNVAILC